MESGCSGEISQDEASINSGRTNFSAMSLPPNTQRTHNIASLSTSIRNWVIKARVTSKSELRACNKGDKNIINFSLYLVDESGEMRLSFLQDDDLAFFEEDSLTFFEKEIVKYFYFIEENKIYLFTGCRIQKADEEFKVTGHDYEIIATPDTIIVGPFIDEEENGISTLKFNFTTLNSVQKLPAESVIASSNFGQENLCAISLPLNTQRTHYIDSLSPSEKQWIVKAKVTSKSERLNVFITEDWIGFHFNIYLLDESGEIRLSFFLKEDSSFLEKDIVEFFNFIELNKIYLFNGCQIKPADKKFNVARHDYEMTANSCTVVQRCNDGNEIGFPTLKFNNFTTLNYVKKLPLGSVIDVIGVCTRVGIMENLFSSTKRTQLRKINVYLVDNSLPTGSRVIIKLWQSFAFNFNGDQSINHVVALKRGVIEDYYHEKTVSQVDCSVLQIDPDIPEARDLLAWFDEFTKRPVQ